MLREKARDYKVLNCIATQTVTGSSVLGDGIDLQGFNSAFFIVNVGANGGTLDGSNRVALRIDDSDDNSTFDEVTDTGKTGGFSVTSSGSFQVIEQDSEANQTYKVAYTGDKRYIRVRCHVLAGTVSLPISATAFLGDGLAPQT